MRCAASASTPRPQRRSRAAEDVAVRAELLVGPCVDHQREPVLAECLADRVDELHGELAVAIGEQAMTDVGEGPARRRPPRSFRRGRVGGDDALGLQRGEVLAHGGFGEAELDRQAGRGGRFLELEDLEHPLARRGDADVGHGTEGIAFRKDSLDKLGSTGAEYRKYWLPLFDRPGMEAA